MAVTDDPTDLTALETDREAQTAQSTELRRRELEDLRFLLAHPQGKRVLQRIFERTGLHRSSFHSSGSVMAFNEGQRNVGLWMLAEIAAASPNGFHKVLPESKK